VCSWDASRRKTHIRQNKIENKARRRIKQEKKEDKKKI
jgi:hypothetical protein